jgi:ribosome-associated heat shock protein Hsp15
MTDGVRIDRWLWAARFFKTRAQAKTAIDGGKVDYHLVSGSNDQTTRPKVSKELIVGDRLTIRRSWTAETIEVTGLSEKRGNANAAQELYRETDESIEARETEVARRRMERAGLRMPEHRPSKRDRRQLKKLKSESFEGEQP